MNCIHQTKFEPKKCIINELGLRVIKHKKLYPMLRNHDLTFQQKRYLYHLEKTLCGITNNLNLGLICFPLFPQKVCTIQEY